MDRKVQDAQEGIRLTGRYKMDMKVQDGYEGIGWIGKYRMDRKVWYDCYWMHVKVYDVYAQEGLRWIERYKMDRKVQDEQEGI